jgi:hypothetical protein
MLSAMRTSRRPPFLTITASVLTLALVACGGGSDADSTDLASDAAPESVADVGTESGGDSGADEGDADASGADVAEAGARPTQEDLCAIVGEVRELLAITVGFAGVEEELGTVLSGDCAIESESVGYISLSLFPAFVGDARAAAESIDGELTTPEEVGSSRLTDAFLVTGSGGLTEHAIFEEGGNIYLVQVENDTGDPGLGAAIESAAALRAVIAAR